VAGHTAVPLVDLVGQYAYLKPEIEKVVCRVLESCQAIMGPEVAALENEVAAYCHTKFAVGCSSGSDAILLAVLALNAQPDDEIIMPPFTFFATAGSVVRAGLKPVFVDIDPVSFNIDPYKIEEKITPRTRAIMPVHLFGQCAEMNPIRELAKKHHLVIIEDAAQSIGAEYHGVRTGQLGDMSCLSFYPSKNLGTYGDAGMTVTDNPTYAAKMKALRVHGSEIKYYHKYLGWNARLDALHAAILRVKLQYLDRWTQGRQEAAARYDRLIQAKNLDRYLTRPRALPERRHVWNQYVIRVEETKRDPLVAHLKENQIGCEIYYPLCLHEQECLKFLGNRKGDYPIAEQATREVLALPMFPEITEQQQDRVTDVLAQFFQK
jgi:dTDP-4-amino-4,6-dideoxygalactose transaminase